MSYCKNLIISCKVLIITVISNETSNELTIFAKLCRNITVLYRQEIASLFQVQEKLRACGNSKWSFSSSCFINVDSQIKIISWHTVVFNENAILRFSVNVHLLKYFSIKVLQNFSNSYNCTNQTCKFPNFRLL